MAANLETATLGGGCFWCTEAVFEEVRGIESIAVGYTGGHVERPSYELVCTGTTGHAEAAQVTFDTAVLSYEDVLRLFFATHDPTTLNRQGHDVGPQYRSAIFWHTEEQRETAEAVVADLTAQRIFPDAIVTEIAPFGIFYEAEEYHQQYYRKNPWAGYCRFVIDPKVAKLRKEHFEALRA